MNKAKAGDTVTLTMQVASEATGTPVVQLGGSEVSVTTATSNGAVGTASFTATYTVTTGDGGAVSLSNSFSGAAANICNR